VQLGSNIAASKLNYASPGRIQIMAKAPTSAAVCLFCENQSYSESIKTHHFQKEKINFSVPTQTRTG